MFCKTNKDNPTVIDTLFDEFTKKVYFVNKKFTKKKLYKK